MSEIVSRLKKAFRSLKINCQYATEIVEKHKKKHHLSSQVESTYINGIAFALEC